MDGIEKVSVVLGEELALVREALSLLIARDGVYEVVAQTGGGDQALDLLRERRPRLAVLDLNLPQRYALEIAQTARDEGIGTAVIVLSSRGDRKTAGEAFRSGVKGLVLKSESSRQLLDALDAVCEGGIYVPPGVEVGNGAAPGAAGDEMAALSPREFQVFSLMVEGVRAKEIAARLRLSPKTVDTYRANMMRKLDIHDLPGLVKYAMRREHAFRA